MRSSLGNVFKHIVGFFIVSITLSVANINATETMPASRIISLQPAVTQTILYLGGGDDLVGISNYCADLDGIPKHLKTVGDLFSPNLEAIIRLKPTVVFIHPSQSDLKQSLSKLNIKCVEAKTDKLSDVLVMISNCISVTGKEYAGKVLLDKFSTLPVKEHSPSSTSSTLIVVSRDGTGLGNIYCATPQSYHGSLLSAAGGHNVLPEGSSGISQHISIEQLIRLHPDIILDFSTGSNHDARFAYSKLATVPAVPSQNIFALKSERNLLPGPFAFDTVLSISQVLNHER